MDTKAVRTHEHAGDCSSGLLYRVKHVLQRALGSLKTMGKSDVERIGFLSKTPTVSNYEAPRDLVLSLVFHEDIKRDYDRFQAGLRRETAPEVRA